MTGAQASDTQDQQGQDQQGQPAQDAEVEAPRHRGGDRVQGGGPVQGEGPPLDRAKAYGQLWLGVGLLIALTIIAGLILMRYRRGVLGAAADSEGGESLLQMLRRARDRGEMTEEEFQAARRKLVGDLAAKVKAPSKDEGRRRV